MAHAAPVLDVDPPGSAGEVGLGHPQGMLLPPMSMPTATTQQWPAALTSSNPDLRHAGTSTKIAVTSTM